MSSGVYFCFAEARTLPLTPHHFDSDGNVVRGVYEYVDEQTFQPVRKATESLVPLPLDWREKWTSLADVSHGANLYVKFEDFANNPTKMGSELAKAERRRLELSGTSITGLKED